MDKIIIPKPCNFHGHLRQGDIMKNLLLQHAANWFSMYLAMPNTKPSLLTGDDSIRYTQEISRERLCGQRMKILGTIKITETTTPKIVERAYQQGVRFGKVYPQGMTTHADDGVLKYHKLFPVFRKMAKLGMHALFHPEHPNQAHYNLDAELVFAGVFELIYQEIPNLKMVWEHLTDTRVLPMLNGMNDNVAFTITVHHLLLNTGDVLGQPYNFCRPVAKDPRDAQLLRETVLGGNPKAILGLDDAPWSSEDKEGESSCAGIWSTPTAIPWLVEMFDKRGLLETESGKRKLIDFTSGNGCFFYRIDTPKESLELKKEPWYVPRDLHGVVPFLANKQLEWNIA
ncbi:dihydroorotase [Candidatus Wolfebacteria bacterium]|nr:MAG: dihydroorotase [Candidatus Wolfebacteria bacterium]